jgi:hypothetical protein
MFVEMPLRTMVSTPNPRSSASRSVPVKAAMPCIRSAAALFVIAFWRSEINSAAV